MLTVGVVVLTILEIILLVTVVACQIIEAIDPDTELFTMLSPIFLLLTILLMLIFLYMFKDCIDYRSFFEFMGGFIRYIPTMIKDFISIFLGCSHMP